MTQVRYRLLYDASSINNQFVSGYQFEELQDKRGRFCEDLERNKHEIAELTRLIQKLQGETDHIKKQVGVILMF